MHQTLDILTSSTLGVTVGCARCHDHKFDPIPQRDYYSLMATLTPAYNPVNWTPVLKRTLADVRPRNDRRSTSTTRSWISRLLRRSRTAQVVRESYSSADRTGDREASSEGSRSRRRRARCCRRTSETRARPSSLPVLESICLLRRCSARMSPEDKAAAEALESEIAGLEKQRKTYTKIEALYDCGPPPETFIHRRGDHESKGATVPPAGLEV